MSCIKIRYTTLPSRSHELVMCKVYCELRRRWTPLSSSSSDSDYKKEKCPDTATEQKNLPDISTFISCSALAILRIPPPSYDLLAFCLLSDHQQKHKSPFLVINPLLTTELKFKKQRIRGKETQCLVFVF